MSHSSVNSAPFGGDYRRPEGHHPQAAPTTTTTSSSNASTARQSHERQYAAQATHDKPDVSSGSASVPYTERRGPGGAGAMESRVAVGGRSGVPVSAAPSSASALTWDGADVPPRLHADPVVGLAATGGNTMAASAPVHPATSDRPSRVETTNGVTTSSGPMPATSSSSAPPLAAPPAAQAGAAAPQTGASSSTAPAKTGSKDDEESFRRPAKALSANLVSLLKVINAQYCAKQRMEAPGPRYNNGFDDREGHYLVMLGEEILDRYTVQEVLGKGSFGTVVRCYDEKRRETVALKITRRGSNFRTQAKLELDLLLKLNNNPALNHLVVKLLKVFDWQGHLVLAFELLSFNLYQLIKCTRYTGVSLDLVRKFAYQLMHTLRHLEEQTPAPIIHCDIKPENILLRNQSRSGIRLIDFGSACYANKRVHRYIQSRFYRSPEVILYLDYTTAIDRWSVGCVLVELFTGTPLFDGRSEAAQLARFEATLGPLPGDMLSQSRKTSKFYTGNATTGYSLIEAPVPRRSLESVLARKQIAGDPAQVQQARAEFLDFITQLLQYHPESRISCTDSLQHPFLMPLYATDTAQHQQHAAPDTSMPH